jgi:hypothetical protein
MLAEGDSGRADASQARLGYRLRSRQGGSAFHEATRLSVVLPVLGSALLTLSLARKLQLRVIRREGSQMRRRELILGLSSAAAWPVVARAQRGEHVRRVGVLVPWSEDEPHARAWLSAFVKALAELRWGEGRNFADGRPLGRWQS